MSTMDFQKLRYKTEQHAIKQAEKDLAFIVNGNPLLNMLTHDQIEVVATGLKHFAGAGAARAVDFLRLEGLL